MPEKSYSNGINDEFDDNEELEALAGEFDELDDAPRTEKKNSFFSRIMPSIAKSSNRENNAQSSSGKEEGQNNAAPKSAKIGSETTVKKNLARLGREKSTDKSRDGERYTEHRTAGTSYTGRSSSIKTQTPKQKPVRKATKKPAHVISDRALKAILAILLIASACFAATGIAIRITANSKKEPEKKIVSVPSEQTTQEVAGKEEGSITGLYTTVVVSGTRAVIGEGAVLHFNSDGVTFSGFFDKDNPSIKGTYTVTAPPAGVGKDTKAIVAVHNNDGRIVKYNLEANEDGDFSLVYPNSKIKIKLLTENGII